MSVETMLGDAFQHFGAGMVVAGLDYATYMLTNSRQDRIELKRDCLKSIEYMLDAQAQNTEKTGVTDAANNKPAEGDAENAEAPVAASPAPKDTMQYAQNAALAMDYFTKMGLVKKDTSFVQKVKNFWYDLLHTERINNLSYAGKFAFAIGAEILYDTAIGFAHYTQVKGHTPIGAWATNLYQIPFFFGGMVAGNGMKKGVNWFLTSKEEKKLNKAIDKATRNTNIVDIVMNYEPPQEVKQQLEKMGVKALPSQLTKQGKKIYGKAIEGLKDGLAYIPKKFDTYKKAKEEAHKAEKEARKKRFEELTKGH